MFMSRLQIYIIGWNNQNISLRFMQNITIFNIYALFAPAMQLISLIK